MESNNFINFSKRDLIFKIISDIHLNQQQNYQLSQNKQLSWFFNDFIMADDKDLYELSLHREPRGVTLQELVGLSQTENGSQNQTH